MSIVTKDDLIVELDTLMGTTDGTYLAFANRLDLETNSDTTNEFGGRFLQGILGPKGIRIKGGVHQFVRVVLQDIATLLTDKQVDEIRACLPDGSEIGGLRSDDALRESTTGAVSYGHAFGTSIDINAGSLPYLINEAGEASLDAVLVPVYEDIAQFMLSRSSTIPALAVGVAPDHVAECFDSLREESVAFKDYFSFLDKPVGSLAAVLKTLRGYDDVAAGAEAVARKATMVAQYLLLTEHPTPYFDDITGTRVPLVGESAGNRSTKGTIDRPFVHSDPREGFLEKLPRGLTLSLAMEGMAWGGVQLGRASGDLMHFQLRNDHFFAKSLKDAYFAAKAKK